MLYEDIDSLDLEEYWEEREFVIRMIEMDIRGCNGVTKWGTLDISLAFPWSFNFKVSILKGRDTIYFRVSDSIGFDEIKYQNK